MCGIIGYVGKREALPVILDGLRRLEYRGYDSAAVAIAPSDTVYDKMLSNIQEIKARGGRMLAVATEGDNRMATLADDVVYIPKTLEMLSPILAVVPLQLFAYYLALERGLDPDRPRNLAKSVTVE